MLFFRLVVHVSKTRCAWNAMSTTCFDLKSQAKNWPKDCIPCRLVTVFTYVTNLNKKYYLQKSCWREVFSQKYTQQISLRHFLCKFQKTIPYLRTQPIPNPSSKPQPAVSWVPRHRSTSQTSRISICTSDNHRTIAIIFNLSCATRMLWIALDRRGWWKKWTLKDMGDGEGAGCLL